MPAPNGWIRLAAALLFASLSATGVQAARGGGGGGGTPPTSRIAFRALDAGGRWTIHSVAADGTARVQLIGSTSGANLTPLDWSADGWMLTLEGTDLRVLNVGAGSDPAAVVEVSRFDAMGFNNGGQWSQHRDGTGTVLPAAQQLIAAGIEDGPANAANVYALNYDGSGRTALTGYVSTFVPGTQDTGVRYRIADVGWLPDGPGNTIRLYYRLIHDTFANGVLTGSVLSSRVLAIDTAAWPLVSVLADDLMQGATVAFDASDVTFSRSGTRVAYAPGNGDRYLWVAPVEHDPTTGAVTVRDDLRWIVADNRGSGRLAASNPSFSPDGARLAYWSPVTGKGGRAGYDSVFTTSATQAATSTEVDGLSQSHARSPIWGP